MEKFTILIPKENMTLECLSAWLACNCEIEMSFIWLLVFGVRLM